jgi:hypothetical protein
VSDSVRKFGKMCEGLIPCLGGRVTFVKGPVSELVARIR